MLIIYVDKSPAHLSKVFERFTFREVCSLKIFLLSAVKLLLNILYQNCYTIMSFVSERIDSSDQNKSVFNFDTERIAKSPSNGSVRYPFQCEVASQGSYKDELLYFFERSNTTRNVQSMRSDYYVQFQESQKISENQIGSTVSISLVNMNERSLQSLTTELHQHSQKSEHKLYTPTCKISDYTSKSIQDVKLRKRNIFREQLFKWNIIPDNQVGTFVPSCKTKVVDGETLIEVARSKDLIYYYVENGLLGKGGFGSVYKGYAIKDSAKTPVAVKFVNFNLVEQYCKDKDLGQVPSEVYYLKKMKDHPNVIKFLHYEKISSDEFVIISERPTQCKDLFEVRRDRGGFFTEYEMKKYVKALVDVVLSMDKMNIVHRDLKLENILYDFEKDDIKLIDFGLARKHKPGKLSDQFAGTSTNVPPEYLINGLYDPSKEAVRSIGVVIYEMLYGRPPYKHSKMFSDVVSRLPRIYNVPDDLENLLTKLFAMDPDDRPSIKQVAKHSWLQGSQSITKRLSSFFHSIFPKRRGFYTVNYSGTLV